MYFFVQLATVEEVENLHHHECIENECEMPGINVELVMDISIIILPVYIVESS